MLRCERGSCVGCEFAEPIYSDDDSKIIDYYCHAPIENDENYNDDI